MRKVGTETLECRFVAEELMRAEPLAEPDGQPTARRLTLRETYKGWTIISHEQSWKLPWVAIATLETDNKITLFNREGMTREQAVAAAKLEIDRR